MGQGNQRRLTYDRRSQFRQITDNERLEFLGDAVLELTISQFLYAKYPAMSEGDLTKLRAAIVCEPSLALIAGYLAYKN